MKKIIVSVLFLFLTGFVAVFYFKTTNLSKVNAESVETKEEVLQNDLYECDLDNGFIATNKITQTPYGTSSAVDFYLSYNKDDNISVDDSGEYKKIGVSHSGVSIGLKWNSIESMNSTVWSFSNDVWGKTDGQLVNGVQTGMVGTGALIVKTSYDGKKWQNLDSGKYVDGLYTTSFYEHYGSYDSVNVYTPSGEDINKGIYIRIFFAYELEKKVPCTHKNFWGNLKHENDFEYYNYIETAYFFLCNDSLESITFHNLTVKDYLSEEELELDSITLGAYKNSETLTNNSLTTTGFTIDNSLNKQINIKVYYNGLQVYSENNKTFTEDGRYDIYLENNFNDGKKVTIYVDKKDNKESFLQYFGEAFLTGKRIFSKGEVPVFEGGLTYYNIEGISDDIIPIHGEIKNLFTGEVIEVEATRNSKNVIINNPGLYQAIFYTGFNDTPSGDIRKFTFNFEIIAEGSAPGPVLNKENLSKYSKNNVSDYNSYYYGVTYSSAAKGYITLAFSSFKNAYEFAYNYEKGMVEVQENGSYRYNGSLVVGQKVIYNSNWDLTDAVHYFASSAVQKLYFDMTDNFTYTTLPEEVIKEHSNLRTLELSSSIVVIANESEREILTSYNSYPIISKKPYSYLEIGLNGSRVLGYDDFEFIKDTNGYDSNKVMIVDCNGVSYNINYNQGVGAQLEELGCATGLVTIVEETIYGDKTEYKAIFISAGTNTTELEIDYLYEKNEYNKSINSSNNGENLFKANFASLKNAKDSLDPNALIKVISPKENISYYHISEINEVKLSEEGIYEVICINRLGFSYNFFIEIEHSNEVYLTINGTDTTIETYFGATNVKLPNLTKYGYVHGGYMDENGNKYNDEILEILFKGTSVLNPIWIAKKFNLTYVIDDQIIENQIEFGEEYNLLNPKIDEQYDFIGWMINGNLHTSQTLEINTEGDLKLIASTKKVRSKITLKDGDNSEEKLYTIGDVITLPELEKEGYEFLGWYINENKIEGNTYQVTSENTMITAKWSEKKVNIEDNNPVDNDQNFAEDTIDWFAIAFGVGSVLLSLVGFFILTFMDSEELRTAHMWICILATAILLFMYFIFNWAWWVITIINAIIIIASTIIFPVIEECA